jgi:hypothetical protein
MRILISLVQDDYQAIGSTSEILLGNAEVRALQKYLKQQVGPDYVIATWAKDAISIALEANGALDGIPTAIEERLAKHGFKLQETGGGCTAYVRNDGEVTEYLTVEDDPTAPTSLTDRIAVGTDNGDWNGDTSVALVGYTLAEALAALENPSDEYHLLELRLHNGLHKDSFERHMLTPTPPDAYRANND